MADTRATLIFVYGTLKTGLCNYAVYVQPAIEQGRAAFVGAARSTNDEFHMMLNDEGFFPCLYRVPKGEGDRVAGEVFSVDDDTIAALDAFERVDDRFYVRDVLDVDLVDGKRKGETVTCQVYLMPVYDDLARLERITNYTAAMNTQFARAMTTPHSELVESILAKMKERQKTAQ
ncbi:unnamed protein product [Hyaloperonospora brassicae]|uniref:Gamma-glutamylcyclotransferase family protein n=1 Tax=Hyaloperonospora brassicae TaxID=162125 RepID=A0AAV0V3Q7_HYABA|nr:unnamed protein product [Hyaloperonospora brassicae]